jgi:uncharacterized membrane protein YkvA (DUF1232 family)
MANQDPNRSLTPRTGFFSDVANRFRLIGRLMMDERVHPLVKLLPVGALIYTVVPVDLLPVNPVDDAFIIWLGTTLFVDLCPPEVVQEHMLSLKGITGAGWKDFPQQPPAQGDVIEGEYKDTGPSPRP